MPYKEKTITKSGQSVRANILWVLKSDMIFPLDKKSIKPEKKTDEIILYPGGDKKTIISFEYHKADDEAMFVKFFTD